jgi:hypothetical protein
MGLRSAVLGALCVASLITPPGAQADVTLGSPLTSSFTVMPCGLPAETVSQTALPGATLTSPFDGKIVSWQIKGASGGPFYLQVVHPLGGGLYTSTGSVASQVISGPSGVLTFSANLPIKAGDTIGLKNTSGSDMLGYASTPGAAYNEWSPGLADGGAGQAPSYVGTYELALNATVAPSSAFTFAVLGKTLNVNVSSPGAVVVTDAAAKTHAGAAFAAKKKKQKLLLNPSSASGGPGTITVPLALTKSAKKTVKKKGKLKLKAKITFTPTGGLANSQTTALKLKAKKKK